MAGISLSTGTSPSPGVSVTVTGLATQSPSTVTVWRQSGTGVAEPVRGARHRQVTASFQVWDHEAPLGVELTYTLEVESGAVTPATLTATITLWSDTAWLSDPLNPRLCLPVSCGTNHRGTPGFDPSTYARLSSKTFEQVHRVAQAQTIAILGSRFPVGLSATRQAPSNLPIEIRTVDAAQNTLLKSLFDEAYPVLLRGLPCMQNLVAGSVFLHAGDVTVSPRGGGDLVRQLWGATVDVVRGPGIAMLIPLYTYGDMGGQYATYGDLAGTRWSYLKLSEQVAQ